MAGSELIYLLQGFPSCLLLGKDIMFEETNIRYTALAYFFFFSFNCFCPLLVFHTHKNTSQIELHQIAFLGGIWPPHWTQIPPWVC